MMASVAVQIGTVLCALLFAAMQPAEANGEGGSLVTGPSSNLVDYVAVGSVGSTWRSTAEGAAAYDILGRLAERRAHGTQYVDQGSGDTGRNYEDFNGTVIGAFSCPTDGFQPADSHCCGPDRFEYCCSGVGSSSVKAEVVLVPVGFILLFVVIGVLLGCRLRKMEKRCDKILRAPSNAKRQSSDLNCHDRSTSPRHAMHHFDTYATPPPAYPGPGYGCPIPTAVLPSYSQVVGCLPSHVYIIAHPESRMTPPPPYELEFGDPCTLPAVES